MKKVASLVNELPGSATGKSTSLAAVEAAANALRDRAQREPDLMIQLDPNRSFNEKQRQAIFERQDGKCAVCAKAVEDDDAEYDHYPIAYARGGKTEATNGRLVHKRCHPRHGRIPEE